MKGFDAALERILALRREAPRLHALLIGLSGIDGAGKGFVADRLIESLNNTNVRSAVLHADGWLNLPGVRFDPDRPAETFYENALRFEAIYFPAQRLHFERDRPREGADLVVEND